jgi:hypothetical protein
MMQMRTRRGITFAVATGTVLAVVVGTLGVAFGSTMISEPTRITVISQGQTTTYLDLGETGWSQGDRLTLHSPLFQGSDEVGDIGVDILVVEAGDEFGTGRAQVVFGVDLPDGQITAQGLFDLQAAPYTLMVAVTGGTGQYQNARGQATLKIVTEDRTRITFDLIP